MNVDPLAAELAEELRARHGCHTVILYGSRATGEARAGSDYDLAGFGPADRTYREARKWRGVYVDVFVHPEARLLESSPDILSLREGVVVFERDGAGTRLLARLEEIYRAGPERLPDDEITARKVWAWKMLERAAHPDVEADYRRAWLLMMLLEDWFAVRHRWFLGPKRSLRWLQENEPRAHAAFAAALRPGADLETIRRLVEEVAGPAP
jgi:predicted nucleotidyltransferase